MCLLNNLFKHPIAFNKNVATAATKLTTTKEKKKEQQV